MGRTLYEILKAKASVAKELKIYNPLKLKIGDNLRIDSIDLRDLDFKVTGIRESTRDIDDISVVSVDYQLIGHPTWPSGKDITDGDKTVRLRLNPMDQPDPVSGLTDNISVLSLYYECGFQEAKDQGLIDSVKADTGEFEINWDGVRKYYRINKVTSSYQTKLKILEDLDGNGRVDDDEIREQTVEFWDYHTELLDEANQKYIELLFVEKSVNDGWFQIWRGSELNPEKIITL